MFKRTRDISIKIKAEVQKVSRDRCCICRRVLLPSSYDPYLEPKYLEKHHIMFHSCGGSNDPDNLIAVCANCHTLIHKDTCGKYSENELRKARDHWISLQSVVPNVVVVNRDESCEPETLFSIPIRVESLGLRYEIHCDPSYRIADIADSVRYQIIEPLAVADDNDLWRRADKIQFTKSQSPDLVVDSGLVVSELRFDEHEYLCVLLTTRANILACLGPQKAVLVDIEQYIKIICHKCSHSIGDFVRDIQEQTKSTQTVTDSSLVSFQVIGEVNIGLRKSLLSACDKLKKFYSDEDLLDGIMAVREVILEIDKGLSVNIGHPIWKEHFLKAQDEFSFCLQSFMSKRIHFPRYLAKNLRYHYMPREELRDNCVNWNNFMTVRKSPKIGEMVNLSIIGNE